MTYEGLNFPLAFLLANVGHNFWMGNIGETLNANDTLK